MNPVLFWITAWALAGLQAGAQKAPEYTQTYAIYIRGEFAGTEKVTEATDDQGNLVSVSEHEVQMVDGLELKRLAFATSMTLAKGSAVPVDYRLQYTSGTAGDYYEVKVLGTSIRRILSRGGKLSEVEQQAGPDTVIFDFNVYHHYDYLIRRYDFKKKGRQLFRNFVPVVGGEIPLVLTYLEDTELDYGSGKLPVRNFRIELVGVFTGALAVDRDNRLVRLVVREKDLEVLRQDIVPK